MIDWENVEYYATQAKGIAFDGCHKIYVLMDYEQIEKMKSYGYGEDTETRLYVRGQMTPDEMAVTLRGWYERSCMLKFIEAVSTGTDEDLFETVIAQGEDDDPEESEE